MSNLIAIALSLICVTACEDNSIGACKEACEYGMQGYDAYHGGCVCNDRPPEGEAAMWENLYNECVVDRNQCWIKNVGERTCVHGCAYPIIQ